MESKKLSAKDVEKAAEKFRKERSEAPEIMEKTITDINAALCKATQHAQESVSAVWVQYRIRKLTFAEAQSQVDSIWLVHKQTKAKAAKDVKAAKAAYRAVMSKKFEYAGHAA